MKLKSIYFMPDIRVSLSGKYHPIAYWNRDEHGKDILCEEKANGSVEISYKDKTLDRFTRVVHPVMIAWRMYEPDPEPEKKK